MPYFNEVAVGFVIVVQNGLEMLHPLVKHPNVYGVNGFKEADGSIRAAISLEGLAECFS